MQRKDSTRVERKLEKLREANRSLEGRLASIRKESSNLRKELTEKEGILNALPEMLVFIQGGKVKEVNQKGLESLGYALEEIQGMTFTDLVHPDQRVFIEDTCEKIFAGKKDLGPYDLDLLTKDGEALCCDVTFHKITYRGRTAFLAKCAAAEARRTREWGLVSSQKDDLIATISSGLVRKLRPSVRMLQDYLDQLRDYKGSGAKSQVSNREFLAETTNGLASLTSFFELLSGEGRPRSRVQLFNLGKVVQDAISEMKPSLDEASKHGAPVNLQCYLRQESMVQGDPEELRNVVKALIRNAVEAMPEGGDLYISAEENAGYSYVYIQDSGSSIPAQVLPRVMDPFFTTKEEDAEGLGLCIARAVLKRYQGDLELKSSKGQGTTVTLRIPLSKGTRKQGKTGPRKRKNTRILVIGDDHLIRDLFFHVLSNKGYRVETAETLSEGFEKLGGKVFDMVIAAPTGGDTRTMTPRIRKAAPQACLALVGGEENGEPGKEGRYGPVDLVIGRPIDMTLTLNRISEILTGRAK